MSTAWDGWATCPTCRARFRGRQEHCVAAGCHLTFAGTYAGDTHRHGDMDARVCRTPTELAAGGMWVEPNGAGTPVWHGRWNAAGVQHRRIEHPTRGGDQ